MRRPEAYLLDMVEAGERLASYIDGLTTQDFLANNMVRAAVVREIEIIGEASRNITPEHRAAHPEVPWAEVGRLRNLYIHAYHGIDYRRVWSTATRLIPRTVTALRPLLPPSEEESIPED